MKLQTLINKIREDLDSAKICTEAEVRQGIVEPLLRCLGWPTRETLVVCPEYPINKKNVDFALCQPDTEPVVFVEIKGVGKIDSENAEQQLFKYASEASDNSHQHVHFLVLTDGQIWQFFYPTDGSYAERRGCELDLFYGNPEKNAYWLQRYLNYGSIQNGQAVQAIKDGYCSPENQRNKELIKLNTNQEPRSKTSIVIMPDGDRIEEDEKNKTFIKVIKKLGIESVRSKNIKRFYTPIIDTSKHPKHRQVQVGKYYILTAQSREDQKKDLLKIAEKLNYKLKLRVQILSKQNSGYK